MVCCGPQNGLYFDVIVSVTALDDFFFDRAAVNVARSHSDFDLINVYMKAFLQSSKMKTATGSCSMTPSDIH